MRQPQLDVVYHSNRELPQASRGTGVFGHERRWSRWCPVCVGQLSQGGSTIVPTETKEEN